jgi:cytochrome c oxidase subunit 3
MATGFHGLHVIIGTIFLAVCWYRATQGHFTPERHVGFEAAAWYWHFVDVVWLFLFFAVYIYGVAQVV